MNKMQDLNIVIKTITYSSDLRIRPMKHILYTLESRKLDSWIRLGRMPLPRCAITNASMMGLICYWIIKTKAVDGIEMDTRPLWQMLAHCSDECQFI